MRITLRQRCSFKTLRDSRILGQRSPAGLAYVPVELSVGCIEAEIELCRSEFCQDLRMSGIADQKGGHAPPRDQIDEFLQIRIEGGLAHEGYGHVPGLACFRQTLLIGGLGPAVAGKILLLPFQDAL